VLAKELLVDKTRGEGSMMLVSAVIALLLIVGLFFSAVSSGPKTNGTSHD
jgi:hypothetical protein